jgi:hypothetical protein
MCKVLQERTKSRAGLRRFLKDKPLTRLIQRDQKKKGRRQKREAITDHEGFKSVQM